MSRLRWWLSRLQAQILEIVCEPSTLVDGQATGSDPGDCV